MHLVLLKVVHRDRKIPAIGFKLIYLFTHNITLMKKLFLLLFLSIIGISSAVAQSYMYIVNDNSKTIIDLADLDSLTIYPIGHYACADMDNLYFNHPQNSGNTSCPIKLKRISSDSIAIYDVCPVVNQMGKTSWIEQNILRGCVGITENGYFISCAPNQVVGDGNLVYAGYDKKAGKFSVSTEIVFYLSNDMQTLTSDGFGVCDAKSGEYHSKHQNFICTRATGDKLYAHEKLDGLEFRYPEHIGLFNLSYTAGDSIDVNDISYELRKMGFTSDKGQNILRGRVGVTPNGYSITCDPSQEVGDGNLIFVGYDQTRNTFSTTANIKFYVSSDFKTLTSDGFGVYDRNSGEIFAKYLDYNCKDLTGKQEQGYWEFATAADADNYLPYRAKLKDNYDSGYGFTTVNVKNLYGEEFYGVTSTIFDPMELFYKLSGMLATDGVTNAAGFKFDFNGYYYPRVWFDVTMIQMYFGATSYPGHFDVYVSHNPIETTDDLKNATKIGSSKGSSEAQLLYATNQQTSSEVPMKFDIPMEYWGESYIYIVSTADYDGGFSGEPSLGIIVFGYGLEAITPQK